MPHVIEAMKEGMDVHAQQWAMLFGDACVTPGQLPDPIEGRTLFVDGSPVNIIEVKQADIRPTSIVHVPEIDVVIAGDSIYNEIHPMLGLSTPEEWSDWLETVDLVESLNPRMIVAGHRRPDGDDHAVATMIAQTHAYIQDFAATYEVAKDIEDLVTTTAGKYPTTAISGACSSPPRVHSSTARPARQQRTSSRPKGEVKRDCAGHHESVQNYAGHGRACPPNHVNIQEQEENHE